MGEPSVEVKSEGASATKRAVDSDEGAPDVKKIKVEIEDNGVQVPSDEGAPDVKKVKVEVEENGVQVKIENGAGSPVKSANGEESKSAEEMGEPDIDARVVSQIEYYFGNFNLPKDKFLQEQIKLDDGWIPISVMLRFQRLASISKNTTTIVSALRKLSSLIEVSEDGTKLRRSLNKPLPVMNEEWQREANQRTVYCKGFPKDVSQITPYLDFFKPYGPVENIYLRKYLDKGTKRLNYKGSAYIMFETKELAEKFLSLESVKFNDTELIRMTHSAHQEERKKEIDERWGKKLKKEGSKDKEDEVKARKEFAKGCILKIHDIDDEELTREIIKSTLVNLGAEVAFIQYSKGEKKALIRLQSVEDGAASRFIKKLSDSSEKVKFGDKEMVLSTVEGEEEEAFLEETRQNIQKSQKGHRNKKFPKGGNRGRGRFRGHNKRGRSPASDGPPMKIETA